MWESASYLLRETVETFLFVGTFLVFIPLAAFLAIFLVFCVVWSPFAVLICALLARNKGMSVWRYALGGAICSLLLLVPWFYLLQRIRGRSVSYNEFVKPSYYGLYALWIGAIFGNIVVLITFMGMARLEPNWLGGSQEYQLNELWEVFNVVIIPAIIGVPTLVISLIFLIRRFRAESATIYMDASALFRPAYLMPYVFAFATIVFSGISTYSMAFLNAIWLFVVAIVLSLFLLW